MVAAEKDGPHRVPAIGTQAFDNLCRGRPAVDQVAEKHNDVLGRRARIDVSLDLRQHIVEQIEPAVNVADRIDAVAVRHARLARAAVLGKQAAKEKGHRQLKIRKGVTSCTRNK